MGDAILPALPRLLAAQQVGQFARGNRDQPGFGVGRDAIRPLHGRRQQPFLDCILGQIEMTVAANERREDLRRQVAQQVL